MAAAGQNQNCALRGEAQCITTYYSSFAHQVHSIPTTLTYDVTGLIDIGRQSAPQSDIICGVLNAGKQLPLAHAVYALVVLCEASTAVVAAAAATPASHNMKQLADADAQLSRPHSTTQLNPHTQNPPTPQQCVSMLCGVVLRCVCP